MTSDLAHFFFFLFPHRLIELHSPDSRNTLILRCKDTATAHSWFVAIHTNIMALLPQVLAELNAMLGATSTAGGSKEVKHIAWLAEQVGWEVVQCLTWLPFRARMFLPYIILIIKSGPGYPAYRFHVSVVLIISSGPGYPACRSFVSPPYHLVLCC